MWTCTAGPVFSILLSGIARSPEEDIAVAFMKRLSLLAALLLLALPARADAPAALCAAAEKPLRADIQLAAEVAAVFGKVDFTGSGDDCLYPVEELRYASADVLLIQAGEPGEGCHGCEAVLSAYVIQRIDGGLKTVAKFREFAKLGSHGAISQVWPIEIAGDDAMVIESGGTFQGYASRSLDIFAFRAGALVDLAPTPSVIVEADNSGAVGDGANAIEATGSWFFDPADKSSLVVDYKIAARGATRIERAVWRMQGGKLALARGRVPPEVLEAAGR